MVEVTEGIVVNFFVLLHSHFIHHPRSFMDHIYCVFTVSAELWVCIYIHEERELCTLRVII